MPDVEVVRRATGQVVASAMLTVVEPDGVDRVVTGDQPDGFAVPMGETWELDGLVTTPMNVVVQ